jgi:hypothetical protein
MKTVMPLLVGAHTLVFSISSPPGTIGPFRTVKTIDSFRTIGSVYFFKPILSIDPFVPFLLYLSITSIASVIMICSMICSTIPFCPILFRPVSFGTVPISSTTPITAPGSASIFSKQPITFFSTPNPLAELLETGPSFLEVRAPALYFPAQVQQLVRPIPLANSFTEQSGSVLCRNVGFFHNRQALGSGGQDVLCHFLFPLKEHPGQFTHLFLGGAPRERFRHGLQCPLAVSLHDATSPGLLQHFVGRFQSLRHLAQDLIDPLRLNTLGQSLLHLVHHRLSGKPLFADFAHLLQQGIKIPCGTALG